ncbi:putative MATE family efflux protein [Fusobacterium naviforme]|nr:MATE family efflux transporter [Fusobacterium naviforme]PSL11433.1 putative MATE family efflux protein [Fusobacterium naviforme]STO26515.1 multidrug efflux protein [Fusobacterium naviforme]
MKAEVRDLTRDSLGRGIFFFSLPLIFSNLLQILFNMSDIAVIGRFAGSAALGAVGSTTTLVTLFTTFLIGIGSGVNVVTARYFGQKHPEELGESVHTALLLCLGIGLFAAAAGELGTVAILKLLNTKEELLPGAALYLHIYFLGMPALALYNFGNAVFSAGGDTRKPLLYLTAAGVLNVLLNLFFVLVLGMDVAGVAIASVSSQYLSAICILRALVRTEGPHALRRDKLRLNRRKAVMILAISVPAGLQNAIFQFANLFVQFGINSFSATVVAGNAAAQNADALVYDVMAAFYTACGSYIGQNYGAGRMDRVWKTYLISMSYAFLVGIGIGGALVLSGRSFLALFTKDPAVLEEGLYRLTIMGCCYGFSSLMDTSISASRGLGRGAVPTVIVIFGSCVFRVAWIFTVFAHFKTVTSLYLLYIFSWAITGVAEAVYFRRVFQGVWHSGREARVYSL